MQVTTITYKRTNNLGNYSSEMLEATAIIAEDEDVVECGKALRRKVELILKLQEVDKKVKENIGENNSNDSTPW